MFGHSLSIKARRVRWGILALGLTPLIGVLFYRLGFKPLPTKCLFQGMVGIPSPGCGMTRSLLALTRGDWQQAFMYHLFGPVLGLICMLAILQTTIELIAGRSLNSFSGRAISDCYRDGVSKPYQAGMVLVLFLAYYAIRLYARYVAIELPLGFEHSPVWQWLVTGAKAL